MSKGQKEEKVAVRVKIRVAEDVTLKDLLDAADEGLRFRKFLNEQLKALEPTADTYGFARCK